MKIYFVTFYILLLSTVLTAQTKITGNVTDQNNQPLPGANIYIKDSYDGVSSDEEGVFSFITNEAGAAVLMVSYVGYKTYTMEILLDGADKYFEIILEEESKEL